MKLILIIATTFLSSFSFAGNIANVKIVKLLYTHNNRVMVFLDRSKNISGAVPACANIQTGQNKRFVTQSKFIVSALQIAQASNKKISITGKKNCADWGDTESINYIQILTAD